MMRYLFALLLFVAHVNAGMAQFHIGVKAGININKVEWKDIQDNYLPLTTPHLGVFTKIKIANKLQLIPELQYITKGYKAKADPALGLQETKGKFGYIELPVLFSYKIIELINIELGPSLGVKVSAREVVKGKSSKMTSDILETMDFGAQGGLRFNITEKIAAIVRYNYSLSPVIKFNVNSGPGVGAYNHTFKAYNRSIQFSIAYQLR